MTGDEIVTAGGVVMFFWDSGDAERHLTVNIEPDDHLAPASFDLTGELRDATIGAIVEGVRIEIDYRYEDHELVDPDGRIDNDHRRPRILAARILPVDG